MIVLLHVIVYIYAHIPIATIQLCQSIQVLSKGPLMSAQKVYQQIVNEDNGGPRHVVQTPGDRNQVKNFQKEKVVVSGYHTMPFITHTNCYQLQFNNQRGKPTDFI